MYNDDFCIECNSISMFEPRIDIIERPKEYEVVAEIPGCNKADVKVEVDEDVLIISGKKEMMKEEGKEGSDYYYRECSYGEFSRGLSLPENAALDKVQSAQYDAGRLRIVVPKKKPSAAPKKRKIDLK
ncbi:MAG: Hsp20/alpha crystallin family protein [Alphaproteobacteria bacterium]|nr:MAG: Hsp20/alpha crystallin family protein [Alphaproteobacteria bacterium]